MSIGARLRFEVFKRDGFRCRYCNATAIKSALVVDHVIPIADGGTDDASNLVAACWECNAGKSSVPLDDGRLPSALPAEAMREQIDQVRAYLALQKELDNARLEATDYLAQLWEEQTFYRPTNDFFNRLRCLSMELPLELVADAITATGAAYSVRSESQAIRYFYGCIRRRRGGER